MIINKNTELFNEHIEVDHDDDNDEIYKWLSLLLLFRMKEVINNRI